MTGWQQHDNAPYCLIQDKPVWLSLDNNHFGSGLQIDLKAPVVTPKRGDSFFSSLLTTVTETTCIVLYALCR